MILRKTHTAYCRYEGENLTPSTSKAYGTNKMKAIIVKTP